VDPDPDDPGFAAEFRAAIREAMTMGFPEATMDRPTFHFADGRTFTPADAAGRPFDWTIASSGGSPPKADVTVLCAIETKAGVGARDEPRTRIGEFNMDEATLYFFEDEWAQVFDFTSVTIGQEVYDRVKRLVPLTLHDVQIEVVEVRAMDRA
jgi:hypothetical protein